MEEGLQVIKGLWGEEPVTFAGEHYTISGLEGTPKPVQRPHPPIYVGGAASGCSPWPRGRRTSSASSHGHVPEGGIDWSEGTEEALARKVGWVREAAGDRFGQLELALLFQGSAVTDQPQAAAAELAPEFGLTAEQVLASSEFAFGSVDQIVEQLLALRERHGISYLIVVQPQMEAFAPVVARLAGT